MGIFGNKEEPKMSHNESFDHLFGEIETLFTEQNEVWENKVKEMIASGESDTLGMTSTLMKIKDRMRQYAVEHKQRCGLK